MRIKYKLKSSVSRKVDCLNNAPTENFWERLKLGRPSGRKFEIHRPGKDEVIDWMTLYNHRRIDSMLDHISPIQFDISGHTAQLVKSVN